MARVPRTVWTLGLVSLFMDISSEIIHALLPLFLTTTLSVSVVMVGLIDGIAEATASISKVFSGYLSDRIGRRKPLILLGYGLGPFPSRCLPWPGPRSLSLAHAFRIASARVCGAPRATRLSQMLRRRESAAVRSAFANRSIPSAHSSGHLPRLP